MAFFRSFRKSIESSMKLGLKKWEDRKAIAMAKYKVNKDVAKASIEYYGDTYLKLRPRVVNEREVVFLSRFGKLNQTLAVGFHLTVPLLDRVMKTISVEEQHIKISDMLARTKDKNEAKVTTRFSLKVIKCIKHA